MANNLPFRLPRYAVFLRNLKSRIRAARMRAALAVNRELVLLYWSIGRDILVRQQREGWGTKVIDRLAQDLRSSFPGVAGFSARNIKYMRAFAGAWPQETIVQAPLAQITWYHNIALIEKLYDPEERLWYARQACELGWSRNVLALQIDTDLYHRRGKATTNFPTTLPAPQSDLASEVVKDPYAFDFLSIDGDAQERAIERGLLDQIRKFLLELGRGFAFVGSQHHIEVGGEDFYIDLLFYHLKLRCFVVVELKAGSFQPEFAGKMSFYLTAVDDLLRHSSDQPTIGIILCRGRNRIVAEYALRDQRKPIGVAEYKLMRALPRTLRDDLPAVKELEAEVSRPALEEEHDPGPRSTDVLGVPHPKASRQQSCTPPVARKVAPGTKRNRRPSKR